MNYERVFEKVWLIEFGFGSICLSLVQCGLVEFDLVWFGQSRSNQIDDSGKVCRSLVEFGFVNFFLALIWFALVQFCSVWSSFVRSGLSLIWFGKSIDEKKVKKQVWDCTGVVQHS